MQKKSYHDLTPSNKGRKQVIRKNKNRKLSSTNWISRQLNDPYVHEANRLGYRSRAAFKILEIHEKYNIFKEGQCVLDLGAAPGGWSQIAAKLVNENNDNGQVLALDILPIDSLPGVTSLTVDIYELLEKINPEFIEKIIILNKLCLYMCYINNNYQMVLIIRQ